MDILKYHVPFCIQHCEYWWPITVFCEYWWPITIFSHEKPSVEEGDLVVGHEGRRGREGEA